MDTNQTNQTQPQATQMGSPKDETFPMLPKLEEKIPKITYLSLFHDTTKLERFLMVIGIMGALASGTGLPLFSLVFGNLTNSLGPTQTGINTSIVDQASVQAAYFVYIGIGIFVCLGFAMSIFLSICEKLSCRIRKAYFSALIRQEIGWFDRLNPNELAAKVSMDTQTIQKGIGESIPTFFMSLATVIGGFVMGFARGWELALVLLGALPLIAFSGGLFAYVLTSIKHLVDIAYVHASGLAEQSINAIKTVKALCSEDFELANFTVELRKGIKIVKKFGMFAGTAIGFLFFCFFSDHGLGFWFGSILVEDQRENVVAGRPYNVGDVITIFICITMGSMILAQVPPPIKSFVQAKDSGANVFYVIKRKPQIEINDQTKKMCDNLSGEIIYKEVDFSYPTRPEQQVLKKVNIHILKNKKTAFVGESGSGKSTLVALLERFYDPTAGGIFIDGTDIRQFNLHSLRKKIGYVGQEPVMFSGTIRDNLLYGKDDATEDELMDALKRAEAYKFVMDKDKKLDTFIGIGGGQLSGGQKQRLAIARAILKNPQILLLDEATSALDRENEMAIQKTLDNIAGGRTTVVVAHRLTTIQDADRIYVMNNGEVAEFGTHQELLNLHGKYEALVKLQLTQKEEESKKNQAIFGTGEIVLQKNTSYSTSFKEKKKDVDPAKVKEDKEKLKELKEKELKEELKRLKKTGELNKRSKRVFRRLFTDYILKHWLHCFVVYSCSMLAGAIQPLMAILMGNIMQSLVLISYPSYKDQARHDIDLYSGMFAVLGAGALFTNAVSSYLFTLLGEKISMELKTKTYDITLRREMPYFDKSENNPGIISSRISFETQNINRLISSFFGVVFNGIGAFICGIILSFIYSWQIALLALGLSPILVIGQIVQGKIHTGFAKSEEAYNEAGAIVMEAAINIRTVASFCNEETFIRKFNEKIDKPMLEASRKGIISGFGFGFSQFLMFSFFAVMFYVAAVLQYQEGLSLKGFFISLFAIIQAAGATGGSSNFLPDVGESVISAEKIFDILDAKDFENYTKPTDIKGIDFKGQISIRNIWFKYANAEKYLFEDFSLEIPHGKKIAFVGPSGCGKSTLFQLLMKFYPVEKGDILIDGISIYKMDVKQLRVLFGVVSQEPTLFQGTVAYNIKYNSNATMDEIRKAAEQANALKFIEDNQFDVLEENASPLKKTKTADKGKVDDKPKNSGMGFDRQVGSKGGQISGGQKQRIAIARAIIRNPRILLLDEATSALDAQNEAIVQDSLNNLMIGKTSLVIAHRISTIKDSEEILMFGDGKIVERGRYEELVAKMGVFYKFERGFGDK